MGNKNSMKKIDIQEVHCYNCQRFDHYARDCKLPKESGTKGKKEVQFAHVVGSDSDKVLLMANTQTSDNLARVWYLNLGCSNHMTRSKSWFIMLDESVKKEIRFAYGRYVTSLKKGNIVVLKKAGQKATITDVLYIPYTTSNLLSICPLLVKGYNVKMVHNQMKVFDSERILILRALLTNIKSFKIEINMIDHQQKTTTGCSTTCMVT